MTQNLTIYKARNAHEKTDIMVMNKMCPKDVIPILRIQSQIERTNRFGLMIAPGDDGMCRWMPDRASFGSIIINPGDHVFVQPLERLITVHLPDKRVVQLGISQRDLTEDVVARCCSHFEIWPAKLWGSYMQARGELILLLPDLSIAEQAPELKNMYLRQSFFPLLTSNRYISPLHVYLAQYREMAINGLMGTTPSDVAVLKRYEWYLRSDATYETAGRVSDQEREFDMFLRLKSYGEMAFTVRLHVTDQHGNHWSDIVQRLMVSNQCVAVFDIGAPQSDQVMKGRPFATIKSIGVKNSELRFTFQDDQEWYVLNHRACEICVTVRHLMTRTTMYQPVHDMRPATVPCEKVLLLPDEITCPKARVSADDMLPQVFDRIVKVYSKLAKKRRKGAINIDYAMQELQLGAHLHQLEDVVRQCKYIDDSVLVITENCLDHLPLINTPASKIAPLQSFQPMACDLKRLNRKLYGSGRSAEMKEKFRKSQELLDSISAIAVALPKSTAKVLAASAVDTDGEIDEKAAELSRQLLKLVDTEGPVVQSNTWTTISQLSTEIAQHSSSCSKDAHAVQLAKETSASSLMALAAAIEDDPTRRSELIMQRIQSITSEMSSATIRAQVLPRVIPSIAMPKLLPLPVGKPGVTPSARPEPQPVQPQPKIIEPNIPTFSTPERTAEPVAKQGRKRITQQKCSESTDEDGERLFSDSDESSDEQRRPRKKKRNGYRSDVSQIPCPQIPPQANMYPPSPYTQMPVYGYQTMPFYQPGYGPQYPSAPSSPSTRVEASPNIIVNLGNQSPKHRSRKLQQLQNGKKKRYHEKYSDSQSSSDEMDSESESEMSVDDIISSIEILIDDCSRIVQTGKRPTKRLKELAGMARNLQQASKASDRSIVSLIDKIAKLTKTQQGRDQQAELMDDISASIAEICAERRQSKTRRTVRPQTAPDPKLEADESVRAPGATAEPGLQAALQKLHLSLSRAQLQAGAPSDIQIKQ